LLSEPWKTLNFNESDIQKIVADSKNSFLLVTRDSEKLAGFALFSEGFLKGCYLKILAVDSDYRGKGIGGQLLREFEKISFKKSPNAYLCVSDFNKSAVGFYQKHGYEEIGTLTDFLVEGKGEIFLRKSIGSIASFEK
jgi:[ribosomal protein S18]-alanine N-acetyltransferase